MSQRDDDLRNTVEAVGAIIGQLQDRLHTLDVLFCRLLDLVPTQESEPAPQAEDAP